MKKILLTLLLALVTFVIHAETFTNGNFTYLINTDGSVLCQGLSSAGASATTITIPGYVWDSNNQTRRRVIGINSSAFSGNNNLTAVTINYGVRDIYGYAFQNCQNLKTLYLPSSIGNIYSYAFHNTSLQWVHCAAETMPSINSTAFYTLKSTGTRYWHEGTVTGRTAAQANSTITDKFTVDLSPTSACDLTATMGTSSNSTLADAYFIVTEATSDPNSGSITGIGKCKMIAASPRASNTSGTLAFRYDQQAEKDNITYYISEIADQAFSGNTTIKALDMSLTSKVDRIGTSAFYNSALTSAIVTAKTIANFAFDQSTSLASVQLYGGYEPDGVQSLGAYSFRNTGVTTVYIPSSLTSYGTGAFCACTSLNKFTCSSNNSYYSADATTGWLYSKSYATLYQVGGANYAYRDQFNTACTTISAAAFWGNTMYSDVSIPYGVKTIGNDAFYNSAVTTLVIPGSVTSFGTYCLRNITGLRHLYINKSTIPSSLTDATTCLVNVPTGGILHVPRGAISNYTSNARWNAVFSGGKYESAYDTYLNYQGNYIYYTVTSTSTYSDPVAQSASTNGQVKVVKGYRAYWPTNVISGALVFPTSITINGKTYMVTEVDRETFRNVTTVTSVSGGAGIKKIGQLAFAGMTGMTGSFNLSNVVEYGDSCLFNNTATAHWMGNRVERIGIAAFRGCTNFSGSVNVPPTVTYIGNQAWLGDTGISSIVLKGTSSITLGSYLFHPSNSTTVLYANLPIFNNVSGQVTPWLGSYQGANRRLIPCYIPTTEWSLISVPITGDVMLPSFGEFYISNQFSTANKKLILEKLDNENGVAGYVGMLMKGTVGSVYYFRPTPSSTSGYTVVNPSTNYFKGVYGTSQSLSASQYVYYLDTSINQFRRWTNTSSSMTVYSGGGYLQLSNALVGSSTANVTFGTTVTTYSLYLAGVQVDELNCSDLTAINGVSGTAYYTPSSNTLTLSNATIQVPSGTYAAGLQCYMNNMTINTQGTNTIKTTSSGVYTGFSLNGNVTMTGSGVTKVSSTSGDGINFGASCTLTIQNSMQIEATGGRYGVNGNGTGKVVLNGTGTKLTANGATASYYRTPTTLNDGLAITSPTGAYFNSSNTVVNSSGNIIKNQNVVFSKPTSTRGDVNGDGSVSIADVTALIDILLSGSTAPAGADCNQDNNVTIADVTALIDYLLSGSW